VLNQEAGKIGGVEARRERELAEARRTVISASPATMVR
jgi:hypothetical protein